MSLKEDRDKESRGKENSPFILGVEPEAIGKTTNDGKDINRDSGPSSPGFTLPSLEHETDPSVSTVQEDFEKGSDDYRYSRDPHKDKSIDYISSTTVPRSGPGPDDDPNPNGGPRDEHRKNQSTPPGLENPFDRFAELNSSSSGSNSEHGDNTSFNDDLDPFSADNSSSDFGDDLSDLLGTRSSSDTDGDSESDSKPAKTITLPETSDDLEDGFNSDFLQVGDTQLPSEIEEEQAERETVYGKLPLDEILNDAVEQGASDIKIQPYEYPVFIILDEVFKQTKYARVETYDIAECFADIVSNVREEQFTYDWELDASYTVRAGKHKGRHMRLNVGLTENGSYFMVFRVIADKIPSLDELGVEEQIRRWTMLPSGLVMMNGPTGTGKSTTMASLLENIKMNFRKNIVSIEKPIEYKFANDGVGSILQREVGKDTRSFSNGLKSALRENPHIIMIGEVRDAEEINELLRAAETGHLAISTMHTNSAAETLHKIQQQFIEDASSRALILSSLASSARGFANQTLLKTKDGTSRFAVREILEFSDSASRDLVREGDVRGLRQYMIDNEKTMEQKLVKVLMEDRCKPMEAFSKAPDSQLFMEYYKKETGEDFYVDYNQLM